MSQRPVLPRGVLLVLGLAVLLNYVDRANLAIAAPLLQDELSLSSVQIGVLLSSFFWVYAPAQLLGGWLVHRFDVRIVMAAGLALWAVATAMTGLAGGFASILAWRLILGLGESVTFPTWQLILARHTLEHERGRANGFVGAGQGSGRCSAPCSAGWQWCTSDGEPCSSDSASSRSCGYGRGSS